ncbi:nucleoside-diphosphate-sugar epimerase [Serpentinimonas raichei]|uniref:Nucleoside-diphosphate-sugar epimerase n=1 Tax=Serpentinimonas raichei TaxID=1458425 RepID=A0A060NGF2_9BURK|nr:NAD-dependent epimerase/dehydratase family protein [Serpentinimonas raichei]BAO79987.1 nucleoside-diphosphate-sugar epimerase [Serpentinimonas raichei]
MSTTTRRVLVTGAHGFIGKNLVVRLGELPGVAACTFVRGDSPAALPALVAQADAVVHLAGENRPLDEGAFAAVNTGLTVALCEAIAHKVRTSGVRVPLLLASSAQAERDNPYGRSKRAAEQAVAALADATGNPCTVFRLPGVFGKWCRPNYNSVVATFCHNLARGLPIQVNDPSASVRLVYVDDVVSALVAALESPTKGLSRAVVQPEYAVTLGELAAQIRAFDNCRTTLQTDRVGTGLVRALYATYVSYLPTERFAYEVPQYADPRGVFVEMLKTPDCGQFSYFTAHPGVTRGGHYHHTKSEKFLVIKGEALFRFRHLLSHDLVELRTSGAKPQVVDTIPGWAHDITNVGTDEMVVMLWANENFDRQRPDTVASKV